MTQWLSYAFFFVIPFFFIIPFFFYYSFYYYYFISTFFCLSLFTGKTKLVPSLLFFCVVWGLSWGETHYHYFFLVLGHVPSRDVSLLLFVRGLFCVILFFYKHNATCGAYYMYIVCMLCMYVYFMRRVMLERTFGVGWGCTFTLYSTVLLPLLFVFIFIEFF